MINNNIDFEKNSNTTTAIVGNASAGPGTPTRNTNNRNNRSNSCQNSNSNSNNSNSNDGGYFNRFDNRIAANLAAVITGSRFRSSSCWRKRLHANASSDPNTNVSDPLTADANSFCNGRAVLNARQPPTALQLCYGSGDRAESPVFTGHRTQQRPRHLFTQVNLNCNDNEKVVQTPSSDDDNSPTELNNCKRLAEKPPLVKRLTMGLLRSQEESRPLVNSITPNNHTTTGPNNTTLNLSSSTSNQVYSNGYINEEAFGSEKFIDSKFGDSCRQSLTAIPMLETLNINDNNEFNLKKRYVRQTSSANSSPKIFPNRFRTNVTISHYNSTASSITNAYALDDEETDLKDASWFQAGISRDIAVEVLSNKSPGAFLVRKSSSKPGCYALTLRIPSPPGPKIANYIILHTARGYKIKGFRKEFVTLKTLITHHSVMPELLPVPLAMPRPTNMTSSRRNFDDFDTYDSLQMLLQYLRAKNLEN